MILSRSCEYAIQAVLHLASKGQEGFVPVHTLADECALPAYFLAKICGELTQHGILKSYRGPNGGVALARPLKEIRLLDVVAAVDGLARWDECFLGLGVCSDEMPCPIHTSWVPVKRSIREMLSNKTLLELSEQLTEEKRARLIRDK